MSDFILEYGVLDAIAKNSKRKNKIYLGYTFGL